MSWDWDKLKEDQAKKRKKEDETDKLPAWRKKLSQVKPKHVVAYSVAIISLIVVIIIMFNVARWLHYKLGYQEKVRQEIIEMVKPESLKDKYRK